MRRERPLAHQLYDHLYPRPTTNDPPSFAAHLARNLVPEVRLEVNTFYGDLNSTEARYPGLNYNYPPHRMRLGRFKYHKRLFDAFDYLGLTETEIQDFCCWEGTKWARERYERDEGIKVLDTTGNEIGPWVDRRLLRGSDEERRRSITRKTEISVVVEALQARRDAALLEEEEMMSDADEGGEDDEEGAEADDETEGDADHILAEQSGNMGRSVRPGYTANYRSFAADTAHAMGVTSEDLIAFLDGRRLPPEIEQRLKEESERRASLIHHPRAYAASASRSSVGAAVPRAAA